MRIDNRILLPTLLLTCACGTGHPGAVRVERTDSAGVEIVRNEGADVPLAWHFQRSFSLGGADEGPASFYHIWPQGVDTDAHGDIYVLDASAQRVVVFDSTGEFLRLLGHKGGGPGEFTSPLAVAVHPDGRIAVYDMSKRGLEWLAADGASLGLEPLTVLYRGGSPIRLSASGAFIPVRETDRARERTRYRLLYVSTSDTATLGEQEQVPGRFINYEGCGGLRMTLPPLFSAELAWDAREGTAAVVNGSGYVIDLYRDATRTRSIRRNIAARAVTEKMALAEVGKGETWTWSTGRCTVPPEEVVAQRGFAPVLPAVVQVALSPDGEVWARRGAVKGEPITVDVFAHTGEYLGTLPDGSPWPVAFLPDGRVIAIEQDELDVERLVVYRVVKGAETTAGTDVSTRDSTGVRIVQYGRFPHDVAHWTVADSAAVDIGSLEGDPSQLFGDVRGMTERKDGDIVVSDAHAQQIRAFRNTGEHVWTVGGMGHGPGEFTSLLGVYAIAGDSVVAVDHFSRSVSVFDPAGRFVRRATLHGPIRSGFSSPTVRGVLSDGTVVATAARDFDGTPGYHRDPLLLVLYDPAGTPRSEVGEFPDWELINEDMHGRPVSRPLPMYRSTLITARGQDILLSTTDHFEVRKYTADGALALIVRVWIPPTPVDRHVRSAFVEYSLHQLTDAAARAQARPRLEGRALPDSLPVVQDIRIDPEGRLWIQQFAPAYNQQPRHWWVFDDAGQVVAAVTFPTGFRPMVIGRDHVAGVYQDSLGVPHVQLRAIVTAGQE